jgi:Tfp pilus assembly protein PilF
VISNGEDRETTIGRRTMSGRAWKSGLAAMLTVGAVGVPALAQEAPPAPGGAGAAAAHAASPAPDTSPAPDPFALPFAATPEIEAVGERIRRTPGGTREKADAIVRFVFADPGGLQFEYRRQPTLTAGQAFHERAGNCLSLVNLFIAMARAAGLEAFPVEVEDWAVFARRDGAVVRSTHVVGGLNVGNYAALDQLWTIDFLPDRPKAYRRLSRIADTRHAALHFNAVAVEAMLAGDQQQAERMFRHALSLDPGSAEAWSNYAVLARRQGDLELGVERLEKALRAERGFLPALNNMASFHRMAGRREAAVRYEQRALEAKYQNPYFLLDQAIRRLQRGELDGAHELVVRARRIDRSIPEVYVVLGRIDLARGQTARAARNFRAARERSEALSPQFQERLDEKIGKLLQVASAR